MRQLDFAKVLCEELLVDGFKISPKDMNFILKKIDPVMLQCLARGETVNFQFGQFSPWYLKKEEDDIEWVNGEGPLAHAENRNRDRVVPKFVFSDHFRRILTDSIDAESEVGRQVQRDTLIKIRQFLRSQHYKKTVWAKARRAA